MSLRCFRIPASIPRHRTITSFRLPPVECDKSALVAFAAEYPEIKDYARSFIRERLHREFYGICKIMMSRYQIQSVPDLCGFCSNISMNIYSRLEHMLILDNFAIISFLQFTNT